MSNLSDYLLYGKQRNETWVVDEKSIDENVSKPYREKTEDLYEVMNELRELLTEDKIEYVAPEIMDEETIKEIHSILLNNSELNELLKGMFKGKKADSYSSIVKAAKAIVSKYLSAKPGNKDNSNWGYVLSIALLSLAVQLPKKERQNILGMARMLSSKKGKGGK